MQNSQVARVFDEIADLLEIQGANAFRVRAYRNASRTLDDLTESIADLAEQGSDALTEIDGIGDDLAQKIVTIVGTGALPFLDELREAVPAGVRQMLLIPGLGPKKVGRLHEEPTVLRMGALYEAAERWTERWPDLT